MRTTEIYTYNRGELNENRVIVSDNEKNDIIYKTEKTLGNLYFANSNNSAGIISYINELVITNKNSFNTSIGTIVNNKGSIVFNFNYVLKFEDSRPFDNLLLTAKPTFVSGEYLLYKNIELTVQIIKSNGDRILAIEYD
jgi:hypothetical protein